MIEMFVLRHAEPDISVPSENPGIIHGPALEEHITTAARTIHEVLGNHATIAVVSSPARAAVETGTELLSAPDFHGYQFVNEQLKPHEHSALAKDSHIMQKDSYARITAWINLIMSFKKDLLGKNTDPRGLIVVTHEPVIRSLPIQRMGPVQTDWLAVNRYHS